MDFEQNTTSFAWWIFETCYFDSNEFFHNGVRDSNWEKGKLETWNWFSLARNLTRSISFDSHGNIVEFVAKLSILVQAG